MNSNEYLSHDAMSLAELVRTRAASPRELVDLALARLEKQDPKIHAVIHRLDDQARRAADGELPDGPLRGVPFLVKDLDGFLGGAPYNGGCRALTNYTAPEDSELFARYRRAGVVFLGKTNTPELGLLGITEPELHGPTRNPWSLEHVPGGSSGGSAAAVAAGIVPVAHGGDGGGSIRIPASACGLFGLKPTRGRMPLGPSIGEAWQGLVVPHVLSRSVRDSAAFLDATSGPDVGAPYFAPPVSGTFLEAASLAPGKLRIGFTSRSLLGETTHADCKEALDRAMKLCESLGHEVREVTLPIGKEALRVAFLTIVAACTADAVAGTRLLTGKAPCVEDFEPSTWFLHQVGHALSAYDLERARGTMFAAQRGLGAFFQDIDVLATPTMAHPPVKVGELALKPVERLALAALRRLPAKAALERVLGELAKNALEKTPNTMLFNMTGQPAMSVPLHWNAGGLPIGVQFVGRFGAEATLFSLASQLEAAQPWKDRRPPD